MVADLLQLPEHREDGSPAVEPALVLLDPRHPAVDRRAVEARLLDGEAARDLRDRDRRQVELDLGRVLRASEHERPHERAEPLERVGVPSELDRAGERPLERLAGAEQARVDEVHDRPELSEAVLDRCPREGERTATRDAPERAMSLRPWVLRVLRLVEDQPVPLDLRQRVDVPGRDVVRGHDDVALLRGGDEGAADEPARPVMQVHAQPRREARDLACPLLCDAHRGDDERRRKRMLDAVTLRHQGCDRLHGLPEAHVVGEDPADPQVAEEAEPPVPALLEAEQVVTHPLGSGEWAIAPVVGTGQERVEVCVEPDLAELDTRLVGLEARDGPDELHHSGRRASPLEEAERALDVRCPERVPASAEADQRLLRGSELGELLVRQLDVADREPPVERRDRIARQEPARRHRSALCHQVDSHPARGRDPGAR